MVKTNHKKVFMTFAAGPKNLTEAANVLTQQAINTRIFDQVLSITEFDLESSDHHEFYSKFNDFIKNHKRGYGYWIWKSYLIAKIISNLNVGDIFIYADARCRFGNTKYLERLLNFLEKNEFVIGKTSHSNNAYCKNLVFNTLDPSRSFANMRMIEAGLIAFRITAKTREIIEEWWLNCSNTDLLIDVTKNNEDQEFIEHRHDQAILSLILYSKFKECIDTDNNKLLHQAILPMRMRRGDSISDLQSLTIPYCQKLSLLNHKYIEKLVFSSGHSSIVKASDISKDEIDLILPDYKGSFSFHTAAELNPFVLIDFVEPVEINFLIIENRKGFEFRNPCLEISISTDAKSYREIYKTHFEFGGMYDGRPLSISLPPNKILSIKISSANAIPTPLHLKSVYLYN